MFPFECGKYSITLTHSGAMAMMEKAGVLTVMAKIKNHFNSFDVVEMNIM